MRLSRQIIRAGISSVLVVAGLVASQVSNAPADAIAVGETITGTAYQDFNSDGANDVTVAAGQATDIGLAGITVKAFDSAGAVIDEATSGANGSFSLDVSTSADATLRVEFSLPTSGPLAAMKPSFSGTQNGTTIRFVDIGATAVDIGFNVPGEFCQNNPNLSVSRLCAGSSATIETTPSAWVTRYDGGPYGAPGGGSVSALTDAFNNWTSTKSATKADTGSILGMAWDPSTRKVYHSAYVRRHAEMYESGSTPAPRPGAIFVTTPAGTTAAQGIGGTTSFLVDLETLIAGDQFSNSNSSGPGYIPTNAVRMIDRMMDGTWATGDSGADNDGVDSDLVTGKDGVFEEVGKAGIGDIETDGRGKLWAVSLYDKKLYEVTLPASGAPTQMVSLGDITSGISCTNGAARPFSVKLWRGSLYLGVVCDASGDFNPATPSVLTRTNLTFTVLRYDLGTSSFSTFFGPQTLNNIGKGRAYHPTASNVRDNWNPWTDTFGGASYQVRPVPMLSEIEFDRDGSMILAFRDRNGDQLGITDSENPDGGRSGRTDASGDVYRVCRTGTGYSASDYVFEGGVGCAQSSSPSPEFGTEYYIGDHWWHMYSSIAGHGEIVVGLTEQVPGFPDLITTAYDPYDASKDTYYSGGVRWLLNSSGDDATFPNVGSGVMFYNWGGLGPNSVGGFMKTNGMSDVEALCDQAPLQIGNRVWIDTDKDGMQDPGETPVAGATVRLYNGSGTLVGTAITNASGEYYFASNVTEAATGDADNVGGGLAVDAAFTIKLDNPADYAAGGPLNGYTLTSTDSTTTSSSDIDDSIDNDSALSGGSTYGVDKFPAISVTAHGPGENDHTFDFGFVSPALATVTPVGMGNYTWIDSDKDGLQDADEAPLAGVVVTLFNPDGTPAKNLAGGAATATTDSKGYYFIDNLAVGRYYAKFTLPEDYTFTTKGDGASALDSNPDVTTGITPVFRIAASLYGDTVADTDSATLARFVNPTIDAGVVPVVTAVVGMGNYTWIDTDKDGLQDSDEVPLGGVVVTLFNPDGTPAKNVAGGGATATTDSKGYYFIDNLLPGSYYAKFTLPANYTFTKKGDGSSLLDSNPDTTTGITPVFTIAASVSGDTVADTDSATLATFVNPTIDAGVIFNGPKVSVGDYVWWDINRDGIQDKWETPIDGVTLSIKNADGSPVADVFGRPVTTTTTDVNGKYSFDNLPPGQYKVTVAPPAGATATKASSGKDVAKDSSTGSAASRNMTTDADRDPTLDFGFYKSSVTLGNRVWRDANGDGIQGPSDVGLGGFKLTVRSFDGRPVRDVYGRPVRSIRTKSDGSYSFNNLPPGQYQVEITYPTGYLPTTEGRADRGLNSSTLFARTKVLAGGQSDITLDFGVVSRPGQRFRLLPATL